MRFTECPSSYYRHRNSCRHKACYLECRWNGSVGRVFKLRTTTDEVPPQLRHARLTSWPPAVNRRNPATCITVNYLLRFILTRLSRHVTITSSPNLTICFDTVDKAQEKHPAHQKSSSSTNL